MRELTETQGEIPRLSPLAAAQPQTCLFINAANPRRAAHCQGLEQAKGMQICVLKGILRIQKKLTTNPRGLTNWNLSQLER